MMDASDRVGSTQMTATYQPLRIALAGFGGLFLLLYPVSAVWPSGWQWHSGAPHASEYFMMIVGIYATLGIFLIRAAWDPQSNLTLIWFTVWSSVVHGAIMAVQSLSDEHHVGHLWGDVVALFFVAIVLAALVRSARLTPERE
jgi:hypothetical protein